MNRAHRNIHSRGRRGRRLVSVLMALLFAAGCMLVPDFEVKAAGLSLSVSASKVKIGDTVTVSITVPAGVSASVNLVYSVDVLSFVSKSDEGKVENGTVSMTLGRFGADDSTETTGTVEFEAITAGTANFSVTAPVAGNQEGDLVSLDAASARVTIENETNEEDPPGGEDPGENSGGSSGNNPGGNDNNNNEGGEGGRKSADNSLSSLVLSAGTLSPEFKYSTVNYRATVDNSVTSVAVSAKVSNSKATIVSVEGGENLVVGENKIQIVVKAENGVTATYTVIVTRRAAGETGAAENTPEPIVPEITPLEEYFEVDKVKRYPVSEFPAGMAQEGFMASELTLWGKSYPCLVDTFAGGILRLVYMVDEDGTDGRLQMLTGDAPYEVHDFVILQSEAGFVIALPESDGNEPEGYVKDRFAVAGKGSMDAWFSENEKDLASFYGISRTGKKSWYWLDTKELTYMRSGVLPTAAQQESSKGEMDTDTEKEEKDEMIRLRKQNVLTIGIAAIIVILLLIVIGMLALRRPKVYKKEEDDLEFIDLQEK